MALPTPPLTSPEVCIAIRRTMRCGSKNAYAVERRRVYSRTDRGYTFATVATVYAEDLAAAHRERWKMAATLLAQTGISATFSEDG